MYAENTLYWTQYIYHPQCVNIILYTAHNNSCYQS